MQSALVFNHRLQVANEDWYFRRGYRLIKTVQGFYRAIFDTNGKKTETKTVFMRKDFAKM